jgi:hypothetical protein
VDPGELKAGNVAPAGFCQRVDTHTPVVTETVRKRLRIRGLRAELGGKVRREEGNTEGMVRRG